MSPTSAPPVRHHALDGLRAVMMLLGLVLHAAVSYITVPLGEAWRFQDSSTSVLFDLLVFYIHVFRMPIFFVIAGFFAALLYLRRGPGGLARNRVVRVFVPFMVGWFVLLPLTSAGFAFAVEAQATSLAAGWSTAVQYVATLAFAQDTTMHLWFLYYLLMFYGVVLLGGPLLLRLPAAARQRAKAAFGGALSSRWRPLYFAVPTIMSLLGMRGGALQTSTSFIPDAKTFVAYLVFFGFGWLLYERRDQLSSFQDHAWKQVILATLLVPVNVAAATRALAAIPEIDVPAHVTAAVSGGIMVWLLVFGITGLFLRYMDQPSRRIRYLVDASYWLYLAHLPLTIWLPGLLSRLAWPAPVKFSVVLLVMTPILLISYDLLVRSTAIGALLNGRRYPRGLPVLDERGHPESLTASIAGPSLVTDSPQTDSAPS